MHAWTTASWPTRTSDCVARPGFRGLAAHATPPLVKRRPPPAGGSTKTSPPDTSELEALYGLEPVLDVEARDPHAALDDFLDVHCPFCGETYGLSVDLSAGERSFIEDCTVCCRPILLQLELLPDGTAAGLRAKRTG